MKLKFLKFNSLFGKLMLMNLIVIIISLLVIGILFSYLVQNYYYGLKEWEATNNGRRIAELVSEIISGGNIDKNLDETKEKINTIARSSKMNIGLMNTEGNIIVNAPEVKDFDLTLEKKEIQHILKGNTFTKKIMGPENKNLLMVIPLVKNGDNDILVLQPQILDKDINLVGAIILQTPLGSITATLNNIFKLILYSFLVAFIAAIILNISFTKRVTKPLENIQEAALKSIDGEFKEVKISNNSSNEIKHLVKTFNYAVNQIKENLKKKKRLENLRKEFVANVSHEFRAPLTSIKGFLEIIKEKDLTKEEIEEYIDIMYKDTEYIEHLLSDLIILGQLDSKNIELDKEQIHPEQLIERAIKSTENKLNNKNLSFKIELEDDLPQIFVDKNRFHQVLINLLENAINYSPEKGTITIRVEKLENTKTEEVIFSITDQGPGIPEKEIDKIWKRFYKVDNARTRQDKKGSGLGLAIVKNIVEKHNGKVKVESEINKGTTFSIIV